MFRSPPCLCTYIPSAKTGSAEPEQWGSVKHNTWYNTWPVSPSHDAEGRDCLTAWFWWSKSPDCNADAWCCWSGLPHCMIPKHDAVDVDCLEAWCCWCGLPHCMIPKRDAVDRGCRYSGIQIGQIAVLIWHTPSARELGLELDLQIKRINSLFNFLQIRFSINYMFLDIFEPFDYFHSQLWKPRTMDLT